MHQNDWKSFKNYGIVSVYTKTEENLVCFKHLTTVFLSGTPKSNFSCYNSAIHLPRQFSPQKLKRVERKEKAIPNKFVTTYYALMNSKINLYELSIINQFKVAVSFYILPKGTTKPLAC